MAGASAPADRAAPGRRGGPLDRLADLIGPMVERLLSRQEPFRAAVDDKLDEALRAETVEVFLARTAAVGLTVGILTGVVGTLGAAVAVSQLFASQPVLLGLSLPPGVAALVETLKLPFLVGVSGLVLGTTGFLVGAGTPLLSLYYEAGDRRREIDVLLPDAVAYMYALSVGGMNQLEIFDAVAESEDVYGEVAREFQAVMQETRYFDTDYRTALRNRAIETPSDSLSQFLTDTLAIVNSGGDMTRFLDDKTEKHLREAKQAREGNLETLELFGEMYMTVSLFPLLLVILLVVMSMMGDGSPLLLLLTVYGLIPGIGVAFVLLIAIVKQDERGGGRLTPPDEGGRSTAGTTLARPITGAYADGGEPVPPAADDLFDRIHRREGVHRAGSLLANPARMFVRNPTYTLLLTVPLAALSVAAVAGAGLVPTTWNGIESNPVLGTTLYVYLPLYVVTVPLALARYRQRARRRAILDELAESLRKLSSANDTGLTLLESFRNVADTTAGRLSDEFDRIHGKVAYGASLKTALVEFNNRYEIPRMARTVNLIAEAQEASSQISDVLRTAAQAAENQDDIERERRTRTRMQITIIVMTYLVLLAVMALLKVQFLDSIAGLAASSGSAGGGAEGGVSVDIEIDRLSMLFFHTVTLQAISAAVIAGYLRESRLLGSVKYMVALPTVALVVWIAVG